MNFQHIVIKLLNSTKLSMKEIAEKSGIKYPTLVTIKASLYHDLKLSSAIKLANFFGISLSQLIGKQSINYDQVATASHTCPEEQEQIINLNIATSLHNLLHKHNISLFELSKKLSIARSTLYDLSQCPQSSPRVSYLIKIAEYFKIDIEELIYHKMYSSYQLTDSTLRPLPAIDLTAIPQWCKQQIAHGSFPIKNVVFVRQDTEAEIAVVNPTFTNDIWPPLSLLFIKTPKVHPCLLKYIIGIIDDEASILEKQDDNAFLCLKSRRSYSYTKLHVVGQVLRACPQIN